MVRERKREHRLLATLIVAGAGVLLGSGVAAADTARTVLGGQQEGPLAQCAAATLAPVPDEAALRACNDALSGRNLSRRDRISTTVNRGVVHLKRREGEAALQDFNAVVALDPRNAEAHLNRGAALVLLKRPAQAVTAITTALSYGVPAPHKAFYNRAAAREALGDIRGAYEDYSTALSIQPDWGPAEEELARFARVRRERLAAQLDQAPDAPPRTPTRTP